MATVNLGVIKPVFKGAYNNSTAYVLDNIVTSAGSSYICILASTGNAVSNGTYWAALATAGTDGSTFNNTVSASDPTTSSNPSGVGHYWVNSTSGECYVCTVATSNSNKWVNVGTGTGDIVPQAVGSGGTEYTYTHGGISYKLHKFTANGNLVVSSAGLADFMVIGGGGGGGHDNGGGGGSGGMVWTSQSELTAATHAVVVGAGANGDSIIAPVQGSNSSFSTATALGGGGGAGNSGNGGQGGSAGGGARNGTGNTSTQTDSGGTHYGGDSSSSTNDSASGGGGGGLNGNGTAGTGSVYGSGGIGISNFVGSTAETTAFLLAARAGTDSSNVATTSSSSGTLYIGGGGAGGGQQSRTAATTALGGGAASVSYTTSTGLPGMANTGSGGSSSGTGGGTGGAGGSGIVIIRYRV